MQAAAARRVAGLAVATLGTLWAGVARADVQLVFEPAALALNVGDSQLVALRALGVEDPGLNAFQVSVSFDEGIISLADPNAAFPGVVEPYQPLGGDPSCITVRGTPTCEDPPWFLTDTSRAPRLGLTDTATPGATTVVFGSTGSAPAPTGDGALLLFEVSAVADGGTVATLSAVAARAETPPTAIALTTGTLTVTVGSIVDSDGDGVADSVDNCVLAANADQRDTNGDGFGNLCDPDLNGDNVVNAIDLGQFKTVFFTADEDADFDGNGIVNVVDLGILKNFFFLPPGPSGIAP